MLHLTGPAASVERLAHLAAERGVDHRVAGGVLSVPHEAMRTIVEGGSAVLAPVEATLVRVLKADLDDLDAATIMGRAVSAPTLANLVARQRNHHLLTAIGDRSGVTVGFQPVVDLAASRIFGYEAFLRVRLDGRDVRPAEVLAAAEDAGRLVDVDAAARDVAITEAAPSIGNRLLFLNVLPASMPIPAEQLEPFAADVVLHGLAVERVVLEAPVGPVGVLRRQVEAVLACARERGFMVGLDNVRSERDLEAVDVRADVVKLDRSLVRGLPSANASRNLGKLVRGCRQVAPLVVAQGIETPEQFAAVRELGVRYAQGWALGRPGTIQSEHAAIA